MSNKRNSPTPQSLHQSVIGSLAFGDEPLEIGRLDPNGLLLHEPVHNFQARRSSQRSQVVVGSFVGQGEGEKAGKGSIGVYWSRIENIVSESGVLFEENANHQELSDSGAVQFVDEMDLQGVGLAIDGVLGRMVEMELPGLEEVIVGLVGESDPGTVSEQGLEVLHVGRPKGDHRVLPIDLVPLRRRTDVQVLLARNVDWRLANVVPARAAPTALVKIGKRSSVST